ncbi:MAG: Ig-like domain-containing protein, partial [Bacteroidota bacterium]
MKPKKLLTTLAILIVILIAGCEKDDFVEVEGVCPLVVSTSPTDGALNVPLNTTITATFNESMDPQTITQASFTVQSPTKSSHADISGTVSYNEETKTASFTPSSLLMANTTYTCKIGEAIKDVNGNAIQTDYVWNFSTGSFLAPTVVSTDPVDLETDVVLDKVISATFSVPMNPATITETTFTLFNGVTQIAGEVTYSDSTAYFNPDNLLPADSVYTATLTTGIENDSGNALANNYVWTFTAASIPAPTILVTDPQHNDIDVPIDKTITVKFSEPMDSLTIDETSFTLYEGSNPVTGSISYADSVASFNPDADLLPGTTYTATISTGVENEAGIALENDSVWEFTTFAALAPTVVSNDPVDLETDVALDKVISVTFSEEMDPLTITDLTFTLETSGGVAVSGTVGLDGTGLVATFTPDVNLLSDSTYIATITTGVENVAGTPMTNEYVWEFATVAAIPPTVDSTDPIDLETDVALWPQPWGTETT